MGEPAETSGRSSAYREFWEDVGRNFPDLGGAISTRLYADNERRLFEESIPDLAGQTVLKTDLWDEAKNTRILEWVGQRGAQTYGVDISLPIILQARAAFEPGRLLAAGGDVRALPFADGSFDVVYSMGTIEHFGAPEAALSEIARVLKPGGRAIVGVPNLWDPFLRPAFVALLQFFGWYAYGEEEAFSRRALRRMMDTAGLEVVLESGILFIPGWLRMAELACHAWLPRLYPLAGACVKPFVFLDRRFPSLRRHGYLIAAVGVKRVGPGDDSRAG